MKITTMFAVATIILCSGCMAGETILLRNKAGDIARCEVSAGDARYAGFFNKEATLDNCVNAYKAAGYTLIGTPQEDATAPRDVTFSDCPQGQFLQNGSCRPLIPGR
jgi:hypothetical protein